MNNHIHLIAQVKDEIAISGSIPTGNEILDGKMVDVDPKGSTLFHLTIRNNHTDENK